MGVLFNPFTGTFDLTGSDQDLSGYLTLDQSTPQTITGLADGYLNLSGGVITSTTLNISDWDTAYGWGNHASAGYAKLDGTNQPFTGSIKLGDNLKTIFGTGLDFEAYYNGTQMVFNPVAATSEIVFNEGGLDTDFRIESDTLPNAFFVNGVNGYVGINTSVPKTPVHISDGTSLSSVFDAEVLSTNVLLSESTGYAKFSVLSTSNTASTRSLMSFVRSRGSTTTPLTVAENDYVGDFLFGAYNGTEVENAASFGAYVDGAVTSTNVPMRVSISTGNNVGDMTERLTIKYDGKIGIGTSAPTEKLQVSGNLFLTTDANKLLLGTDKDYSVEWTGSNALHKKASGTFFFTDGSILGGGLTTIASNWEMGTIVTGKVNPIGTVTAANDASSRGICTFVRARGTIASPTAVQDNDYLGDLLFGGYDGTGVSYSSGVFSFVDGTVSSGSVPSSLSFVTGTNSTTRTERLKITSTGDIKIPADSKKLYFGAGDDASITYDGTNLLVNTSEVGSGVLGLNTTSPKATVGGLDISSGGLSLILGADSISTTRTDATTKQARIGTAHYTNAEAPIAMLLSSSSDVFNIINWGGGSVLLNTATSHRFYTGSTTTTKTGTIKFRIDDDKSRFVIDDYKLYFGGGDDCSITYDGTNMLINPKAVGSGILDVAGTLQVDGYNAADGSAGITTTFVDADGNTITVKNGLITAKTAH